MNFKTYTFEQLNKQQLYDILQLRAEVFAIEQKSIYQDLDGLDQIAQHICLYEKNTLIAYARLLPANSKFVEVSFGRFVVAASHRKLGLGGKLLAYILLQSDELYGVSAIRIIAQSYLQDFYEKAGFEFVEGPFIFEDVFHVEMLKRI